MNETDKDRINTLSSQVIGAAIEVHKEIGPGLLESAYEECLSYELIQQGLKFERQVEVPVVYKKVKLNCGYKVDILVENVLILELKAVETIYRIHDAQLLTYLRLMNKKCGLIINFNVPVLKTGIKRIVNGL